MADLRVNFTRLAETHGVSSSGFNPTQLGFPSYMATGAEYLQMPIASLSTYQSLGASGANAYPSQNLQLFGDVVKVHGNHTIKFGVDLRQYRMNFITYGNSTGSFTFNNSWDRSSSTASTTVAQGQDLASLLMGLPGSGSLDRPCRRSWPRSGWAGAGEAPLTARTSPASAGCPVATPETITPSA